jgi:arylsulfatase A-like enzyme
MGCSSQEKQLILYIFNFIKFTKDNELGKLFRLIFVAFFLYLTGDAFYRWDGFSYYASFYEFLPAVALASILWIIVAGLTTIIIWMSFSLLRSSCRFFGLKINFEHFLLNILLVIFLGVLVWGGKKLIWPYVQTAVQIKLAVFLCITILSVVITWIFRDRSKRLADIVQEKITPLVWLFGILVFLAIPLVAYYAWIKSPDVTPSQKTNRHFSVDKNRPNIILVTFDALAARNMSVYGYHRETTPFIDRWAKNATVFMKTESSSNFTTPAAASLITGKRVWTHQTYQIAGTKPVRSDVESLPSLLKDYGYFNIAFVVNPFASVDVLGMKNSFDIAPLAYEFSTDTSLFGWKFGIIDNILYREFGTKIRLHNWIISNEFILSKVINLFSRNIYQTTVPPDKVFNRFLGIMDNNLPQPFFAWLHLFPPHDPYLPPAPFKGIYSSSPEFRSYKRQEKLIDESYTYLFQHQPIPKEMEPAMTVMRDYYDEYLKYTDSQFGDFIDELNKRKIENTLIILTADHGESFDHGYLTHGGPFLYEQVTHIPLIIREPGQNNNIIKSERVEQIDIPATILDFVDIPVPSWMEGRSLVPVVRGETIPARPAFSMNFEGNPSMGHDIINGNVAVWDKNYKLIYNLGKNQSRLFNLAQDPDELDNLIERERDIGKHLGDLININLHNANKTISIQAMDNKD